MNDDSDLQICVERNDFLFDLYDIIFIPNIVCIVCKILREEIFDKHQLVCLIFLVILTIVLETSYLEDSYENTLKIENKWFLNL